MTTSGWPHYRLQDIQGPFGYWSEHIFPSSRSTWPERAPLQGTLRYRLQRRGLAFSVMVVKYWNKLPPSVDTAPSVNVFKKRLEEVWTEVFPHLPPLLHTPPPPAHHSLTVIMSIHNPTPCFIYVSSHWREHHTKVVQNSANKILPFEHQETIFLQFIYVVSSGPLWPTFYYYKSES